MNPNQKLKTWGIKVPTTLAGGTFVLAYLINLLSKNLSILVGVTIIVILTLGIIFLVWLIVGIVSYIAHTHTINHQKLKIWKIVIPLSIFILFLLGNLFVKCKFERGDGMTLVMPTSYCTIEIFGKTLYTKHEPQRFSTFPILTSKLILAIIGIITIPWATVIGIRCISNKKERQNNQITSPPSQS